MPDFNHFYNANAGLWLTSIVINLSGDELMLDDVANPLARGKGSASLVFSLIERRNALVSDLRRASGYER